MTKSQKAKRNNKIFALYCNKEMTKTELAARYNLSFVQIDRICKKEGLTYERS